MFVWLKKKLDHWAIRAACASLPQPNPRHGQIAEARQMLASGNFFELPERPAELAFLSDTEFSFKSLERSPWARNNRVPGKFFRAGTNWQDRPAVLLLHGWNAELQYEWELPWLAKGFARRGVNAAMFQLPLHGLRRPHEPGAVRNFISDDIPAMLRATRQALVDINSFAHWARQRGCPAVGLWGFSMGAWLAGLHLCLSPVQDATILTTPICDLGEAVRDLEFCAPIRAALNGEALDFAALNLKTQKPKLDPRRILVTWSDYDQFAPVESMLQLERSWGNPEVWHLPHSHISILMSLSSLRQMTRWEVKALQSPD